MAKGAARPPLKINRKGLNYIMLNLGVNERTYGVSIKDEKINILPPKLKHLRKIVELSKHMKNDEIEGIDGIADTVSLILSQNSRGNKYTAEWVEENLSIDDIKNLLSGYTAWLDSIKNSPNLKSHIAQRR